MAWCDWLLEVLHNTEMKAWISGVQAIMQAIDFPFEALLVNITVTYFLLLVYTP